MKTIFQVKQISTGQAKARAFAIRMRVFVREQGVPAEIELDEDDAHAIHLLAFASGRAVGTARIVLKSHGAKIGRMAVLKSYRRLGVGAKLLKHALAVSQQHGARRIYLHAQVPVIGFYEKLGFSCAGPVFDEAGIPHRKMVWKQRAGGAHRTTGRHRKNGGRSHRVR